MLLIGTFFACSPQVASTPTALLDAGGESSDSEEPSDGDCQIVAASSSDAPSTWGASEVSAVLTSSPSGLTWTSGGPDPTSVEDPSLSLTVEVLGTEWIRREGSIVGSDMCRDGVELAVDAQWTVDVDGGEAAASGEGTLYAASTDAEDIYLDVLELSGNLSAAWQSAAEDSLSSEYGWNLTLQESWIVMDGTWSAADLAVEGKFGGDTNPQEGPRTVLGVGPWSL